MDFGGQDEPREREVVPDGSGRYTAERMTVREERPLPLGQEQFGWHRGFQEFVPRQSMTLFGAFLFDPEKEAICTDSAAWADDGDPVPLPPPNKIIILQEIEP